MKSKSPPEDCIPDLMEFARIASVAQDIGSLRSHTLDLIRGIFRSDSTIFWLTDQDNRPVDPLEVNVQHQFFPMYLDYFFRKNPFDPGNMGAFAGTSVSMEQVVPYDAFQKSEYYNDFIRPQKIRRQMVVYIRVDNKLTSVICTHRFKNERFNQEDLTAGDMVSNHLSTAFGRIRVMEEIRRKGSLFQMMLENADLGIVALDLKKIPVFMNKRAVHICESLKKNPISKNERGKAQSILPPPVLDDCNEIRACLQKDQQCGMDSSPARERILWISPSAKCLVRSRMVTAGIPDFDHPVFYITMEILPVYPGINDRAVKKAYSLTKREFEIVSYIFKGYRNGEIAESLFISEGTVKNHLRNIFEKVRVKNRTGLIHRMLSL